MNKIEELIQQYCPNGVEFKELGDCAKVVRGKRVTKSQLKDDKKYPVISGGFKPLGYFDEYNRESETITIAQYGSAGFIAWQKDKFWANDVCYSIYPNKHLNNRFLYFVLSNQQDYIYSLKTNAIPAHLPQNLLEKIQIPVPPLQIQQEIVSILDSFTQLEAELEARRAQYAYYRAKLLNFNNKRGVYNWLTLRELCLKTDNIKWKENDNIDFKYIDLSSVDRMSNKITETQIITSQNAPSRAQQIVRNNDVIFGTTRPTLKRYCLITPEYDGQICSTGFCVLRANTEMILPKYLFFVLTTSDFYNYVENNQEGAGYPAIPNSKVMKYKIPIPPLSEQNRIVAILDKFDSLVNSISEGLPAEIEARATAIRVLPRPTTNIQKKGSIEYGKN